MIHEAFSTAVANFGVMDGIICLVGIIAGISEILVWWSLSRFGKSKHWQEPFDKNRRIIVWLYRMYQFFVESLPLLGTLGTVMGLLSISDDTMELQKSFLFALTTTMWGLLGVIFCKILDSIIGVSAYYDEVIATDEKNKYTPDC